jgi:ribosomal protein S18 acetylase RimI-like enzyme
MISSSIILREATRADQIAVQHWLNPDRASPNDLEVDLNVTNWVVTCFRQITGFVQLVRQPPGISPYPGYWLFSLNVNARWRGLGIGETLCQAVIERSRLEGAQTLDLLVFEDNIRAIQLYGKLGFEKYTIPDLEKQLESERDSAGRRRMMMRKQLAQKP